MSDIVWGADGDGRYGVYVAPAHDDEFGVGVVRRPNRKDRREDERLRGEAGVPNGVAAGMTRGDLERLRDLIATKLDEPEKIAELHEEIKRLRQGLWDVAVLAGVDTDGDKTPDHLAHPGIVEYAHRAVRELREDYEQADVEAEWRGRS